MIRKAVRGLAGELMLTVDQGGCSIERKGWSKADRWLEEANWIRVEKGTVREKKRNRGELCDREKERDPRGEKKRERKG